jgi:hypothetical protein
MGIVAVARVAGAVEVEIELVRVADPGVTNLRPPERKSCRIKGL